MIVCQRRQKVALATLPGRMRKTILAVAATAYEEAFRTKVDQIAKRRQARQGNGTNYRADSAAFDWIVGRRTQQHYLSGEQRNRRTGATLACFHGYLTIDAEIRDLGEPGQARQKHLSYVVGAKAGAESEWAFDQFDKVLENTIKINRDEFERYLDSAAIWLAGLDNVLPFGMVVVVTGLTVVGLRPRLKEYQST